MTNTKTKINIFALPVIIEKLISEKADLAVVIIYKRSRHESLIYVLDRFLSLSTYYSTTMFFFCSLTDFKMLKFQNSPPKKKNRRKTL